MKTYPSIPKNVTTDTIYAFDKLDGSNIRAEWNRKRGFYKYGTRKRLLGPDEKPFGLAIELINDTYGDELFKRFKHERVESAIAYFEFFGENSFAGWHNESDNFEVVLFDVSLYKKGFLGPVEFMKFSEGLKIPEMVYHGKANEPFIQAVRNSQYPGVTFEGVVCKFVKKNQLCMFKIKSDAWLAKLKTICNDDDKLFEQLS